MLTKIKQFFCMHEFELVKEEFTMMNLNYDFSPHYLIYLAEIKICKKCNKKIYKNIKDNKFVRVEGLKLPPEWNNANQNN